MKHMLLAVSAFICLSNVYASDSDCKKKLDLWNQGRASSAESVDSHTKLLIHAAANRIAGRSPKTQNEKIEKLSDDILKATYSQKKLKLIVFSNSVAEVLGYIKGKDYWCMQERP